MNRDPEIRIPILFAKEQLVYNNTEKQDEIEIQRPRNSGSHFVGDRITSYRKDEIETLHCIESHCICT